MKCSKCQNNINQKINCLFCKNVFCSYSCMESHIILFHKKNLMINILIDNNRIIEQNNNISNSDKNQIDIQSPYLIPGILNKKRNYEQKYNLENFIPIFENEKPKIIGGGSFGQVFLVMNKINKKLYAIKHMEKKSLSKKLNSFEGIYKEIYIQSRIDHPNILPILYVNETSSDFDLVLEYASGGSLFHFIRKNKYLDEPMAFSLFIQVINAIYFLHKNNLIHRDIKPENILLFDNNIIKLCDFGWCVKLEEGQQRGTFCGTTEYMSPELVNHEEYSKEIDVWSLGVLLYEMVHGYSPFRPDKPNFNAKDVIENIRLHKLKFNKNISEYCKELIYHLLDEDPCTRYKVEDIFNSDFVKFYEKRKFGLPDNYLIEKYKFKLAKVEPAIYSKTKKSNNNCSHSKSFSGNIIINKNMEKIEDKLNEENLSHKEKNVKFIYNKNRKNMSISLSDIELKGSKSNRRKLKKNKTTQYFHPLNIIENKINICYLGHSKSKNNSQRTIMTQYNNIKDNKENIENNNQQISNNDTKIKSIIINDYFPNVVQNSKRNNTINIKKINEEQKNNNSQRMGQILPYKKNFHIKPLKMSKIPINSKICNNIHSPTNRVNTILDKNYLIIKKHLSPKVQLNIENNKTNSFQKTKMNDSKLIEVQRSKNSLSPKITIDTPNQMINKNNYNKKTYTRNNMNANTKLNYNSDENNTNTNNTNLNNHSCTNYLITNNNNDDIIKKKIKEKKLYCTKSLNQLKRNFNDDNIKSMFISNIKNEINNNSIISDNKNASNKNTIHIKGNSLNLNINDIKTVNPSVFRTQQNSPLNTFNNNFIYTIFNNDNKKQNNNYNYKNNIQLRSNNIATNNSYNYINKNKILLKTNLKDIKDLKDNHINFPKIKVHKTNISTQMNNNDEHIKYKYKIHLDKILNSSEIDSKNNKSNKENKDSKENISNKNIYYEKSTKLLNSVSQSSIFHQNKKLKLETKKKTNIYNKTENDKKIRNIPKIKTFKKNEKLNIDININNKQKIEYLEKYRCNSNSNINNQKISSLEVEKIKNKNNLYTNRDNLKNKIRNNSNRENNTNEIKFKIIKKLELNEFLNNLKINKEKKNITLMTSGENHFNTSNTQSDIRRINRINTSINSKNCIEYFENSKQRYDLDIQDNKTLRSNNDKYSIPSRNSKKYEIQRQIDGIKSPNNNMKLNNIENKSLNLENKIKIIIKREPKVIISPILSRNKKNMDINKNNGRNIKEISADNNYKNKLRFNQADYKVNSYNEVNLEKYRLYKKENFNGYS